MMYIGHFLINNRKQEQKMRKIDTDIRRNVYLRIAYTKLENMIEIHGSYCSIKSDTGFIINVHILQYYEGQIYEEDKFQNCKLTSKFEVL